MIMYIVSTSTYPFMTYIPAMIITTDSTDNCTEGQLRLLSRSSSNRMEGTVQICAHGYWGTVCGNSYSWDSRSADVVCNQLGYATHS